MKYTALAAAVAAAIPAAHATLTINTPASMVACQPSQLSWAGGSPPYYVSILPGGMSGATPLEVLPTQNGTSYTWNVDVQPNTSVTVALKDGTGSVAYTSIVTIQSGTSTSCVNATGSAASSSTSSGSSGSSSSGGTPAGSSATGNAAGSASAASSASSPGATSSGTSSKTSGAGRLDVSAGFGVAGIMGLVGATLF